MNEYVKIPNIYKREEHGSNSLIKGQYTKPELEYLAGLEWSWTEKVDGTNIRIIWDGYRVSFKGRTDKADTPKALLEKLEELFGGESKEELFENLFGQKPAILYGEGYGGKIQSGGDYGDVNFILFDAVVDGYWLKMANVQEIAASFGINYVPIVGSGTLDAAVEYIKSQPKSQLRNRELEGIVVRPMVPLFYRNGEPIMVKIKCRDFR